MNSGISERFSQATQRELARLGKSRAKLVKKRDGLRERLDAVAVEIAELDRQRDVLRDLVSPGEGETSSQVDDPRILRGASIRRVGVPILQHHGSPIHYRQWLALVEQAGYTIAGKRPDAVFLNRVSRSALVRSESEGWYAFDSMAEGRLTEELREAEDQLATVAGSPDNGNPKAKHADLTANTKSIARVRRELDEIAEIREAAAASSPSNFRALEGEG